MVPRTALRAFPGLSSRVWLFNEGLQLIWPGLGLRRQRPGGVLGQVVPGVGDLTVDARTGKVRRRGGAISGWKAGSARLAVQGDGRDRDGRLAGQLPLEVLVGGVARDQAAVSPTSSTPPSRVLVTYTGQVLVDPANDQIAAVFGLADLPTAPVDVAIVGVGRPGCPPPCTQPAKGYPRCCWNAKSSAGRPAAAH